ncbi:MAG: hypothetical protein ACT4N8_11730 [Sphingosinicella sp.]|uniref:hypothetical protein n=1 Tax=Sphingosinicella sp. TaxID=1917971 RepID=UPI004037CF47
MSLVRNNALRLALTAILASAATAASANILVVRSSGPSAATYPPGRSLPDNSRVTLRANDVLVVLDGRGTRTYRGAGAVNLSQAQAGTRTVVAANGQRARVGAVRSAAIFPSNPSTSIWQIDASQGGTVCLPSAAEATLWRPDATRSGSLTIGGPGGASQQVNWPAGQATLAWPAAMQIADGAEYSLSQPGVAVPTQVRVKLIGPIPGDLPGVAATLIRNECQEQLDLLVAAAPIDQ